MGGTGEARYAGFGWAGLSNLGRLWASQAVLSGLVPGSGVIGQAESGPD